VYLKKYDEAIYHYSQALQVDSNNPTIYFNLGIELAKKGEIGKAIEHFLEAISLKPDYDAARRALRLALDIQQRQKR
jgi:tetratricopeptide (TPR) repeat protein